MLEKPSYVEESWENWRATKKRKWEAMAERTESEGYRKRIKPKEEEIDVDEVNRQLFGL